MRRSPESGHDGVLNMKELVFSLMLVLLVSGVSVGQDSVFVQMAGDTVTIWDKNAMENCTSRFQISIAWANSMGATMTETDTVGAMANCVCSYDLSSTLVGLSAGHYSVGVHRQYLKRYGYDRDTTVPIGSVEFDISRSGTTQYAEMSHQSNCLNETAVAERRQAPQRFELATNYPNPFNPTTTLSFVISHQSFVSLKVYDGLGREVAVLAKEVKQPGEYSVEWNAEGFASGVYFYRLNATGMDDPSKNFLEVKKMVLIR